MARGYSLLAVTGSRHIIRSSEVSGSESIAYFRVPVMRPSVAKFIMGPCGKPRPPVATASQRLLDGYESWSLLPTTYRIRTTRADPLVFSSAVATQACFCRQTPRRCFRFDYYPRQSTIESVPRLLSREKIPTPHQVIPVLSWPFSRDGSSK